MALPEPPKHHNDKILDDDPETDSDDENEQNTINGVNN